MINLALQVIWNGIIVCMCLNDSVPRDQLSRNQLLQDQFSHNLVPVLLQTHRVSSLFLWWFLTLYFYRLVQIHLDVVFCPFSSIVNANLLCGPVISE